MCNFALVNPYLHRKRLAGPRAIVRPETENRAGKRRTRPYSDTLNIPPVCHRVADQGNSPQNQSPAVDPFYTATKRRSRGALRSIFAQALSPASVRCKEV
jgi:hypothetical protein